MVNIPQAIHALDPGGRYRVTNDAVKYWFNIFNEEIFNNELPKFNTIQIRPFVKNWAMCIEDTDTPVTKYKLSINIEFPSFQLFLNVLSHEMVHLYQFVNGDEATHNRMFYSWVRRLKANGLDLKESYPIEK